MQPNRAAWKLTETAAEAAGVRICRLSSLADARRMEAVTSSLWGERVVSPELVRAFQHAGSILFGAEANGELVGVVLGFLGFAGGLHVHSHILGVSPAWQSRGVGYALKLAQRAACLDVGVVEVRWTYDPLLARNARFNLVKLGAVADGFLQEFYGRMEDLINRGDRSDRFEVRWLLNSPRVERALRRELPAPDAAGALLERDASSGLPSPRETGQAARPGAVVAIPPDYQSIRESDPALAMGWRVASGRAFESCFRAGLVATWLREDAAYVFESRGEER